MRETARLTEAERVWVELGRLTFSVGLTEDVLKCSPYLQITDSFININKREPHVKGCVRGCECVCARVCTHVKSNLSFLTLTLEILWKVITFWLVLAPMNC